MNEKQQVDLQQLLSTIVKISGDMRVTAIMTDWAGYNQKCHELDEARKNVITFVNELKDVK